MGCRQLVGDRRADFFPMHDLLEWGMSGQDDHPLVIKWIGWEFTYERLRQALLFGTLVVFSHFWGFLLGTISVQAARKQYFFIILVLETNEKQSLHIKGNHEGLLTTRWQVSFSCHKHQRYCTFRLSMSDIVGTLQLTFNFPQRTGWRYTVLSAWLTTKTMTRRRMKNTSPTKDLIEFCGYIIVCLDYKNS